jgi:hypothetical protein
MLTALQTRSSGFVRSDPIPVSEAQNAPKGPTYVRQPGFTLGPFWSDYTLPL